MSYKTINKNKMNTESKGNETTRDKGVTSTDLLALKTCFLLCLFFLPKYAVRILLLLNINQSIFKLLFCLYFFCCSL